MKKESPRGYYYRGEEVNVEKVKEVYEERYKREPKRANQKRIHRLLNATSIPKIISRTKKPTAIDVGCGYGHYVEGLRLLGCNAYGIDLSKRVIDNARKLYPECTFLVGDGLQPRKRKFNIVFCRAASFYNGPFILENEVVSPHKILATERLMHLIKPKGLLVIIQPTQSKHGKSEWDSPEKRWFWTTEKELQALLSIFGFSKISSQDKRPKGRHLIGQIHIPKSTMEWPICSQYRRFRDVLIS